MKSPLNRQPQRRHRLLLQELRDLALLAAGAVAGALLRWQLQHLAHAHRAFGLTPALRGDLAANLIGSLLIGVLLALSPGGSRLYLWAGIGFCGSLTTFSSWMLEVVRLWRAHQAPMALVLLLGTLLVGMALVAIGYSATTSAMRVRHGRAPDR